MKIKFPKLQNNNKKARKLQQINYQNTKKILNKYFIIKAFYASRKSFFPS